MSSAPDQGEGERVLSAPPDHTEEIGRTSSVPDKQSHGISEEGRWRYFTYEEIAKRDKMNLDIFWLKDKSLEDSENLPEPDVLA